jgi:hypothetical protein
MSGGLANMRLMQLTAKRIRVGLDHNRRVMWSARYRSSTSRVVVHPG